MAIMATGKDFATEGGNWYCAKTGEPRYTVVGANGKSRNTTLADARKLGFVPSVTTIAKVEAKPQLTNWLVQQGMLACLTLPRLPGETDQDFMKRALEDSKEQVRAAANRGTYLHGLLEETMRLGSWVPNRMSVEDEEYVFPVVSWIWERYPDHKWSVERSFASELGYGGKVDLVGTKPGHCVIIDYKAKDFSDPEKKLAYPEHCSQLCAYAMGMRYDVGSADLVNIFLSSTSPGLFVTQEWNKDEKKWASMAFRAMLDLWKARNKV